MKKTCEFVLTKTRDHILGAVTRSERYMARSTHHEDQGSMVRAFLWQTAAIGFSIYAVVFGLVAKPLRMILKRAAA